MHRPFFHHAADCRDAAVGVFSFVTDCVKYRVWASQPVLLFNRHDEGCRGKAKREGCIPSSGRQRTSAAALFLGIRKWVSDDACGVGTNLRRRQYKEYTVHVTGRGFVFSRDPQLRSPPRGIGLGTR